jgi:hypothetical protein
MQQRFVMGIKMARFSMTKNLEDFRVTLDRMSMAAKWNESLKYAWECKGAAACKELKNEAAKAPERAENRKQLKHD